MRYVNHKFRRPVRVPSTSRREDRGKEEKGERESTG